MQSSATWIKSTAGIITATVAAVSALATGVSAVGFYFGDQRYAQRENLEERFMTLASATSEIEDRVGSVSSELQAVRTTGSNMEVRLYDYNRRAEKVDAQLSEVARQQLQIMQQQASLQSTMEATLRELNRMNYALEHRSPK